jgi:hypothetical protein
VVDCRRRIVEAELLFSIDGHGSLTNDILILRQIELLRQQRHFKTEHGPIALRLQFQPSCPLRVTGYIQLFHYFCSRHSFFEDMSAYHVGHGARSRLNHVPLTLGGLQTYVDTPLSDGETTLKTNALYLTSWSWGLPCLSSIPHVQATHAVIG